MACVLCCQLTTLRRQLCHRTRITLYEDDDLFCGSQFTFCSSKYDLRLVKPLLKAQQVSAS